MVTQAAITLPERRTAMKRSPISSLKPHHLRLLPAPALSSGLQNVVDGVHKFQHKFYKKEQALFQKLAHQQHPEVVLLTCVDSRIDLNHITQAKPGDILVPRNAGNIVPVFGKGFGEEASIEYAIKVLNVRDLVIMGHSDCGAMKGLLHPEKLRHLPSVSSWLTHASEALEGLCDEQLDDDALLALLTKRNVVVQMTHLISHPSVSEAISRGELQVHGWFYDIEKGNFSAYNPSTKCWCKL
jgi:carbonic anhydrase